MFFTVLPLSKCWRTSQKVLEKYCLHTGLGAAWCIALIIMLTATASAQKHGKTLRTQHVGDPPSLSIHEEATNAVNWVAMPVMNNLVLYDVFKEVESIRTIKGELAKAWRWNKNGTRLTFDLRKGVKWHDGKPFTAKDVKYTWRLVRDLASPAKLRKNPRKIWYRFLKSVETRGDYQVVFHLKRRQPSFLAFLASGYAPVYPSHVSPVIMRTAPIGTGPFMFKEWNRGQKIRLVQNPHYFRKGRPYLKGITYFIVKNRDTRVLALAAGEHDMSYPSDLTKLLRDSLVAKNPKIMTVLKTANVSGNLLLNPDRPPLNDPDIRRAFSLALDRQAFIDSISRGDNLAGGVLMPPPYGVWGLPTAQINKLYGNAAENRKKAQRIMAKKGYSPNNPLKMTVSTRNISVYRDPAILLVGQLKTIYVQAQLEEVESSLWFARLARRDYQVGMNFTGLGPDDPDAMFYENFTCDSQRNYGKYCNRAIEKLFDQQSQERSFKKRLKMVHAIERKLIKEGARPIVMHLRSHTAWQPYVKNIVLHQSLYNTWRMDEVWLDK